MKAPALLPCPRSLKILRGTFTLPKQKPLAAIKVVRTHSAPDHPEGYALTISKTGIEISFREAGDVRPVVDAGGIFNYARASGMIAK